MKLFRIEVTKVIYMMADDEDEAIEDGPYYADEETAGGTASVTPATTASIAADGWRGALVYNSPNGEDTTAEQALIYGDVSAQEQKKLKDWNQAMEPKPRIE